MNKLIAIVALAAASTLAIAGGVYTATDHHRSGTHGDHMSRDHHGLTDGTTHAMLTGKPGDPAKVTRTIEVVMNDSMRFTPDTLKFKEGETVRFVVRNEGTLRHEMVIGTMGDLKAHGDMMRTDPSMSHNATGTISLAPGESGELIWEFGKAADLDFACLVPGHLEAGMTGKIRVN